MRAPVGDLRVSPQFSRMVRELLTLVWIAGVIVFVCFCGSFYLSNASSSFYLTFTGDPRLPSCSSNGRRISAFSRSRRAARGGSPRPDHL
jgi:hypothetical protein